MCSSDLVAKKVWDYCDICVVEDGQEWFDVPDIALQILDKRSAIELEMFLIIAWSIWYNRNLIIF